MTDKELKEQLVQTTLDLYRAGVVTAKGGNLSVRSVVHENAVWITPSRINKGSLKAEQMVLIGFDGKKIEGEGRPSVESSYHAGLMEKRKDINAVIHTHAPLATILGMTDMEIPPITSEAALIMDYPRIPFFLGGSKDLANAVLEKVGESKVSGAFLCNHGLVTVGKDLQQAAERTLMVERVLQMLFIIKQLGLEPSTLPENAVKLLAQFAGVI